MIIQDRNLPHLNSFIIVKVSQAIIHHRLKNKDLGKTTTKRLLNQNYNYYDCRIITHKCIYIYCSRNSTFSRVLWIQLNLITKCYLKCVNIPLISTTTESSNPLGKTDWNSVLINKQVGIWGWKSVSFFVVLTSVSIFSKTFPFYSLCFDTQSNAWEHFKALVVLKFLVNLIIKLHCIDFLENN